MNKDEKFEILRNQMREHYKRIMPKGYDIYLLAEYSHRRFTAPHLLIDHQKNTNLKYIAILACPTRSVSALGETVVGSVAAAILKIERNGKPQ